MPKPEKPAASPVMSRRALLGASAAVPAAIATSAAAQSMPGMHDMKSAPAAPKVGGIYPGGMPDIEGLETLTALESDILEAVCARLIPSDETGPGAKEARAAHYIDRSLAGALMNLRSTYADGLSALDAQSRETKGKGFADLSAADQDAVLHDLEANRAKGFSPNSAAFFNLMRTHTIEGTFCDPYYGGNANFVGWDLIGYPGIRMPVTPEDQRLIKPPPLRESAYVGSMFARGKTHG